MAAYSEVPIKGLDESCAQEMNQLSQRCDVTGSIKQCVQQRLSPDCAKKTIAGNETGGLDPSCKQELQQPAMPCTEIGMAFGKQCVDNNLSKRCKEQLNVAGKILANSMQAYQEALQRRLQICKTEGQNEVACLQRHQSEVDLACPR